jgi:hypothetical protein
MRKRDCWRLLCLLTGVSWLAGCAAFPDRLVEPTYHNPFPQLHKVAVLPFYNQSHEPTVDGDHVAETYFTELQSIPGFEVMPVGVARRYVESLGFEPRSGEDFQRLARMMNMDAVLIGSITDYSPYYPPRMGLAVDWYAANPSFHPVPAGYGLPWGTPAEEYIPSELVQEAEFALAREQLKTQTPPLPPPEAKPLPQAQGTAHAEPLPESFARAAAAAKSLPPGAGGDLPPDWPDPRGFVPPPPQPAPPAACPQTEPIITHTKLYRGNDNEFTQRLANYFYFQDDARFGGWQGHLQRPDDFVRFCCHLHVAETLTARGGAGRARVVWRWPINRYER